MTISCLSANARPSTARPAGQSAAWRVLLLLAAVGPLVGCQMAANSNNAVGARAYQQGNYQAAIYQFQQALANDPNNADANYNLAATYHQIGKTTNNPAFLQQAEFLYNRCLNTNPNHVDCYRGLAVLLVDTKRADKAFTLLQNWATTTGNSDGYVELARLYEEYGDKDSARRSLEGAVAVNQLNARAWTALGKLREDAGDKAGAITSYQRAFQINPNQTALASRLVALGGGYGYVPGSAPGLAPTAPYSPYGTPGVIGSPYAPTGAPAAGPRIASPATFPLR